MMYEMEWFHQDGSIKKKKVEVRQEFRSESVIEEVQSDKKRITLETNSAGRPKHWEENEIQ